MKPNALALMEAASHAFLRGYSGQQEIAPNNNDFTPYTMQNLLFRYIYTANLLL